MSLWGGGRHIGRSPLNHFYCGLCVLASLVLLMAIPARAGASGPLGGLAPRAYVVGTYDGSVLRIYVDGRLAGQAPVRGLVDRTAAPLEIGSFLGRAVWDGEIDEVAVYNRALTPSAIAAHYQLGLGSGGAGTSYPESVKATPGLVSYWRLDDQGLVAVDQQRINDGSYMPGVVRGARSLISGSTDDGFRRVDRVDKSPAVAIAHPQTSADA
jgi:hypothetical protein